jgi:hypothetical protein
MHQESWSNCSGHPSLDTLVKQPRPILIPRQLSTLAVLEERHLACEVYLAGRNTDDRHRLWEDKTGLKKTAFRDRLREARASGLFDQYRKVGKPETKAAEPVPEHANAQF